MVALHLLIGLTLKGVKSVISNHERNVHNRTFNLLPKATTPYDCPPTDPDGTTCGALFDTADDLWDTGTWSTEVSGNANTAVNNYIAGCGASKCQAGCKALASAADLTAKPTAGAFGLACDPGNPLSTTILNDAACPSDATNNEETCEGLYTAVITATTVAAGGTWSGAGVQTAVNNFITACKKTACNSQCKSVISGVNVKNEYTKLKTTFTSSCRLSGPDTPPVDSGFKSTPGIIAHLLNVLVAMSLMLLSFN
jgi:hypothetical protein